MPSHGKVALSDDSPLGLGLQAAPGLGFRAGMPWGWLYWKSGWPHFVVGGQRAPPRNATPHCAEPSPTQLSPPPASSHPLGVRSWYRLFRSVGPPRRGRPAAHTANGKPSSGQHAAVRCMGRALGSNAVGFTAAFTQCCAARIRLRLRTEQYRPGWWRRRSSQAVRWQR